MKAVAACPALDEHFHNLFSIRVLSSHSDRQRRYRRSALLGEKHAAWAGEKHRFLTDVIGELCARSSEPSSGRSVGGDDRRGRRVDRRGARRQRHDDEGRGDGSSRGWNSGSRSSIRAAFASRLAGLSTGPVSVAVGLFGHAVTRSSKVCSLIFLFFP